MSCVFYAGGVLTFGPSGQGLWIRVKRSRFSLLFSCLHFLFGLRTLDMIGSSGKGKKNFGS